MGTVADARHGQHRKRAEEEPPDVGGAAKAHAQVRPCHTHPHSEAELPLQRPLVQILRQPPQPGIPRRNSRSLPDPLPRVHGPVTDETSAFSFSSTVERLESRVWYFCSRDDREASRFPKRLIVLSTSESAVRSFVHM